MSNLSIAQQYLGNQKFDDLCQAFVEQATYGHQGVYPSAIAAWNAQTNNARQGTQGISPGDIVYFSPNQGNGYNGHTGIYTGNNQFISATDNGVQYNDLNKWQQATGQKLLGYVPQGQNAQGLGQQINTAQRINQNAQKLQGIAPVIQKPTYDFNSEMDNFKQVWDATHSTPLANYM